MLHFLLALAGPPGVDRWQAMPWAMVYGGCPPGGGEGDWMGSSNMQAGLQRLWDEQRVAGQGERGEPRHSSASEIPPHRGTSAFAPRSAAPRSTDPY